MISCRCLLIISHPPITDIVKIYFTSGTTGKPKMVPHTHSSYGYCHYPMGKYWLDLTKDDLMWNISDTGDYFPRNKIDLSGLLRLGQVCLVYSVWSLVPGIHRLYPRDAKVHTHRGVGHLGGVPRQCPVCPSHPVQGAGAGGS